MKTEAYRFVSFGRVRKPPPIAKASNVASMRENVASEVKSVERCKTARREAAGQGYKLTDSHRLYLLVKPNGGKLWRRNYSYDGKQKSMNFGVYPLVSLVDARAKRDEAYAVLSEGRDPSVAKKLKVEANLEAGRQTFEKVAREWHENAKAQWAKIHAADIIRSLERDIFPSIGDIPIVQLTPPLILAALRDVEARGSIETAKRIRQRISAVFVYAIAQGIAPSDPAEKLGAVLQPLRKGRQPAITDLVLDL